MMNKFKMMDDKYSNFLTILLVIVIVAILILLGFWAYDVYKKYDTEAGAAEAIEEFDNEVTHKNVVEENTVDYGNVVNPYSSIQTVEGTSTVSTTKTYKGFVMSGYIEIPKTGVKLPVLNEVTKKSIETSVAILYGPGLNKVGNTVIVGHNYRNGMFFSNNAKIEVGDKIYITDETGNKVTYIVYNTYDTTPEDADYMTRDTKGAMEISLSTCTDDSSGRIIIWAKAEN